MEDTDPASPYVQYLHCHRLAGCPRQPDGHGTARGVRRDGEAEREILGRVGAVVASDDEALLRLRRTDVAAVVGVRDAGRIDGTGTISSTLT